MGKNNSNSIEPHNSESLIAEVSYLIESRHCSSEPLRDKKIKTLHVYTAIVFVYRNFMQNK